MEVSNESKDVMLEIVDTIKNAFYPDIYPHSLSSNSDLNLLLLRKHKIARYVLAVSKFDPKSDLKKQIESARSAIKIQTSALWLFKEVGAYLVLICDELPEIQKSQLKIDRTGLHSVIIQGVHLISKSGNNLYNHSKWLNRTVGSANCISIKLIESMN